MFVFVRDQPGLPRRIDLSIPSYVGLLLCATDEEHDSEDVGL
jgi:hypothetical protein